MIRTLFILVLTFSTLAEAYGQKNPYVKAVVFLQNGEVLKGEVDSTFARKQNIKVFLEDDSHELVNRSHIDSIHCNGNRYVVDKIGGQTTILRIIDEGKVDLFQMNGRQLVLKRDDIRYHPVLYKKYRNAYYIFCQDSTDTLPAKMSRTEFSEKVRNYNASPEDTTTYTNYDWLKSYAYPLIWRFSLLTPSAGVEVKLTNYFSFYAGMAINFFGDDARGAKTFLNYNYTGEFRYFFMPKKRLEKGKHNYNFTGPYFGATYNYLVDTGIDNAGIAGLVYGWQESGLINRTFQSIKIGLGSELNTGEVYLLLGISTGWCF